MGRSIWEHVAANQVAVGDIISWHANPDSDGVPDDSFRVRVTRVGARQGAETLPYVVLNVAGPTGKFERLSGVTTSRMYRQGDAVRRMAPERAARVSPENLRTVVKAAVPTSAERLEMARTGRYARGVMPGDL